jgi:hypothetical protein
MDSAKLHCEVTNEFLSYSDEGHVPLFCHGSGYQAFLKHVGFLLSVSFHQCCKPNIVLMLLLAEGQTDEAWEPSDKAMLLRISGSIGQKVTLMLLRT